MNKEPRCPRCGKACYYAPAWDQYACVDRGCAWQSVPAVHQLERAWDALPVNSSPLAPMEPKNGETERDYLQRAREAYRARADGITLPRTP